MPKKRLLLIGDFHIPSRAKDLPNAIKNKIQKEKFDFILCTGDFVERKVLDYLSKIAKLYPVQGNMDYLPLPTHQIINVGKFKIGLIHGTEVYPRGNLKQLFRIATQLQVDILISGHTHSSSIDSMGNILLLNPGSATGVWGGGGGSLIPSFMILEIIENEVIIHLFQSIHDHLSEEIHTFKKK